MTRLVAIGSGKGGVGKTWFAISVSQALARLGRRTLLIDGDVGLANVDVQLGLAKGPDLGTALLNERPIATSIRTVPSLGMDILAGRSGSGATVGFDPCLVARMISALQLLRESYEVIVVDLPSSIDRGVRRMMMAADDAIILTTEEPTALTDAYALMKSVRKHKPDLLPKIVVNLVENHQAGHRIFEGLSRVCDRFLSMKPDTLGAIRRDRRVAEAIGRQTPLFQCYPNSDAAQDIVAVAETLARKISMR